jgi:malic enzyme
MREMHKNFPNLVRLLFPALCASTSRRLTTTSTPQIIQFEDFHTTLAFPLLTNNREVYPCFNDDIQGTGAVVLAGAIRAFAQNGVALRDQRILFFGAGSSGVGVAETICKYFEKQGMSEDEARKMFWLVDSKVGFDASFLVFSSRKDGKLTLTCSSPTGSRRQQPR